MASQVTQCPKCHTSFRVTETQLNIANGAVRCGSCLHIFNATDHWLDDITNPALKAINTSTEFDDEPLFNDTGQHQALNMIFDDEDDFLIDDQLGLDQDEDDEEQYLGDELQEEPEEELEEELLEPQELQYAGAERLEQEEVLEQALLEEEEQEDEDASDFLISDDMDEHATELLISDDMDEQQAEAPYEAEDPSDNILIDDNTPIYDDSDYNYEPEINTVEEGMMSAEDLNLDAYPNTGEYSETFLDLDSWEQDPASIFKELDDLGEEPTANEEEWAEKLLEEDEDPFVDDEPFEEIPEIFETSEELEPQSAASTNAGLQSILDDEDEPAMLAPFTEEEFVFSNEPMQAGSPIGNSDTQTLLANIEPEPVVMRIRGQGNNWIKRGWAASIVVALIFFGAQFVSFNFDRLARDSQYRPLLASACNLFGCELPSQGDIRQILSSNLMVRSHPEINNALVVDAIITNRASFKQSFPVMELQFTDLEGKVVAGRRFTPNEYLAGELTGASLMPTRQPIHISLEIVDPGQDAVNYQLYFRPQRDG